MVLLARLGVEDTADSLALLDRQDVLEVEDGLLPVSVLCVGTCGEADGLVAGGKLDVEPGDDSVNKVAAADLELVVSPESEIGDGACVQVECDDSGGVGDDSLDVDGIDEGLGQGGGLERRVVEAPDVVPDWLVSIKDWKKWKNKDSQPIFSSL